MPDVEQLKALCYNDRGGILPRPQCRSALINHLILEEMMDVMDAEDFTDQTLRDLNLWPEEPEEKTEEAPLP